MKLEKDIDYIILIRELFGGYNGKSKIKGY
jgi:hypothetical protein